MPPLNEPECELVTRIVTIKISTGEIWSHVYGKQQTSDSNCKFLKIENTFKQIKTLQDNTNWMKGKTCSHGTNSAVCCKLDSKSLYYHTVLAFMLTCCHSSPLQPTTAGDH